jgi:hypothetical protein
VEQKQEVADSLDQQVEKRKQKLETLKEKTAIAKAEMTTVGEINHMGEKRNWRGVITVSPSDWKTVSGLAKEGVKSRSVIADLKKRVSDFLKKITGLEQRLEQYEGKGITDSVQYFTARQRAPRRMAEMIADIMRKPPEKQEHNELTSGQKRSHGLGI